MKSFLSRNWLGLLGFLLFIPSLFLNFYLFQNLKKAEKGILVIEVLDGDTILLEGDVKLRLRNVDAPELQYCGGSQAKDLLTKLTKDRKVVIKEEIIDQWGRPMALIFQGNTLVNLEILKSGWARFHHDQSSRSDELKKASDEAKGQAKGIFSHLCYQKENPIDPNCNIKGNIDKNSGAKKYYFPGCVQYDFTIVEKDIGDDWFCTENEAQKAGFIKAETCR